MKLQQPRHKHQQVHESAACEFLESKGLTILERNYTWRGGEIDIIALDKQELVFVEVKYREDEGHGGPLEHILAAQIRRIHNTALIYLEANSQFDQTYYRFDALGLTPVSPTSPEHAQEIEGFNGYMVDWIKHGF